jgi:molybdopterin synthase catalytic subunit
LWRSEKLTHHAGVHEKGSFSFADLMDSMRKNGSFNQVGAIDVFIGVVRGESDGGQKVQKLFLEAYEEKANEVLESICNELMTKPGIIDVQIHHLLGEFTVGDDMVYVAVAGSHRTDVFPVLEEAVERYKHEAPVFKKEHVTDAKGESAAYWVSEKGKTES